MTLTKAELADLLFEQVGLQQARSQGHGGGLLRGDPDGAGARRQRQAFRLRQLPVARQAAAPGSQPKTGEEIPITARRVVTFHASQKLKAAVEQLPAMQANSPENRWRATAADSCETLFHDR